MEKKKKYFAYKEDDYPKAEKYYSGVITLPFYVQMKVTEKMAYIKYIVGDVKKILK